MYEAEANPSGRFFDFDRWEAPEGAYAKMRQNEAAISSPPRNAPQDHRLLAHFVWSRGARDHPDPAAPGARKGRLYQFVVRSGFPSRGVRAIGVAQVIGLISVRDRATFSNVFQSVALTPKSSLSAAGGQLVEFRGWRWNQKAREIRRVLA